MKNTKDFIKIESIINRENDQLPFVYFHPPSEGKVTWHCGYDQDNKLTTVFCYKGVGEKDRKIGYLKDIDEALFFRDELVKEGWEKMKPPQITTSVQKKDEGIDENLIPEERQESLPSNFAVVPISYLEDPETNNELSVGGINNNVATGSHSPETERVNRKTERKISKPPKGNAHRNTYG